VYDGSSHVEEVEGVLVRRDEEALEALSRGTVPVMVDPAGRAIPSFRPYAVVDAILAKRNLGTLLEMAPLVVALGPGFTAGIDCHVVVETNRGPNLGRVLWKGSAEPNTGMPAPVRGQAAQRVLRAPADGRLETIREIGDTVEEGEIVAAVGGAPVRALFRSMVRGLARSGLQARAGMKIGDLDPRIEPALTRLVSDKALAVAGGVLEAVMMSLNREGP
jgi:xanthine dehydrogenase accessory factor